VSEVGGEKNRTGGDKKGGVGTQDPVGGGNGVTRGGHISQKKEDHNESR